jgi:cobalt-zinc-cadmium resistance protein CzcA
MLLAKLVEASVRNRVWVVGFFAVAVAYGAIQLAHLPIDAVPDVTNVQVVVNTHTAAFEPERSEQQVTYPIETELAGIGGIEEIRSLTKYGLSQVTAVFRDGTDIYWARQQVVERLATLNGRLPAGISPELSPMTTGLGEVFMYELRPKAGGALEAKPELERLLTLRTLQEYLVRPVLRRIAGVADVDTNGGFRREVHVNVIPARLERTGLSFDQVFDRLDSLGERFGGGYVDIEGRQWIVRTDSGLDTLDKIREASLGLDIRGRAIRVADIGDVRSDHALRVGSATSGGVETVLGTVLMRNGANSREVARASEAALAQVSLPADVEARVLYTRSFLVEKTIGTVAKNLAEGAFLVVLVLLLFLGELRPALLVSLAIPASLLVATNAMHVLGISANLMSLGAIDFGLVVDGAVVMIENAVRRLGEETGSLEDVVVRAAKEVATPVAFGVTTIILVYLPILALEGTEGKLFRPMALTVILVLSASLLIALTLVPALASFFLKAGHRPSNHRPSRRSLASRLETLYEQAFRATIERRWIVWVPTLGLVLTAGLVSTRLGTDFVPALDEGDLVLNVMRSPGIALAAATEKQRRLEHALVQVPGVAKVFSRLGTPESATDPMGPHLADTFVVLDKNSGRPNAEVYEAVEKAAIAAEPDADVSATQPIQMRFNELLEGSRADVSLKLLGPDLNELVRLHSLASKSLEGMPGLASMSEDPLTSLRNSPVLSFELDPQALSRTGIPLRNANQMLEMAMAGRHLGSFEENGIRFPVLLHLDESLRADWKTLGSLPLAHPAGGTVPLSSVATLRKTEQVTTIARHWGKRYAALAIQVRGRDLGSFVAEAKTRVAKALGNAPVEVQWGGQFKNLERAEARLALLIPLTLAVVFLLLARLFGDVAIAGIVFTGVPLAAVGGVFSLALTGLHLSVAAAVGFIALIGVAVLNGSVLVTFFQQLRREGRSPRETVLEGTSLRFRPVMMTAIVAILGFMPMALGRGIGAEVQRPLATVVIGGLFTSTVLTLFLVPMAYEALERWRERQASG